MSDNGLTYRFVSNSTKHEYTRVADTSDKASEQYWSRKTRIPWKAICLALFLFIVGTALIVISALLWTGFVDSVKPNDEVLVLLGLGLLMFIPGFYHMRIAFYAYKRYEGYLFDDIPDFD